MSCKNGLYVSGRELFSEGRIDEKAEIYGG